MKRKKKENESKIMDFSITLNGEVNAEGKSFELIQSRELVPEDLVAIVTILLNTASPEYREKICELAMHNLGNLKMMDTGYLM